MSCTLRMKEEHTYLIFAISFLESHHDFLESLRVTTKCFLLPMFLLNELLLPELPALVSLLSKHIQHNEH